jgi:leucyl-tRNA synthetase
MELLNVLQASESLSPQRGAIMREALESMVLLLAPFVPHITEELWQRLGHATPLSETSWPEYDRNAIVDDEILVVVQVNGKLRSKLTVSAGTDEESLKALALADEKVQPFLQSVQVRKVICVQGKLVNIVVG